MPVGVSVTEIINTVLGSIADESKSAETDIVDLRTDMPAIIYEQDSVIDMNEGSFNEAPATPIAAQDPENYHNDHSVAVAETVTVSILSSSSSESRPVNVRSNMTAITTKDLEIDMDKSSFDSNIDESSAKPAAKECSKNHDHEQMNEVFQHQPESWPK